jgi:hypothetical protein
MQQVSKKAFFDHIGPLDVQVSADYERGKTEIVSNFKMRMGDIVGVIILPLPAYDVEKHQYFLRGKP